MVPVIVGANDADLAASPAQTKEALFAQFGVLASQARALYDPTTGNVRRWAAPVAAGPEWLCRPSRPHRLVVAERHRGSGPAWRGLGEAHHWPEMV